jgi:TPR repeat protein
MLWPKPKSVIRRIEKAYQGDRDSMATLARDYHDGVSVPQNPALAYMWFALLARWR